ncbi:putative carbonic anhydrase precursor [Streptococcus mutans SA38]|uniref:carbonic anhydrase n=1 Tax=Streptococcus mutans TaxID=1309 RepID=UPI0002B58D24|nr:carbonic anhydrase family protein [Streptococcus mutans]EMC48192.1 putative carbonic anhydrase precursor [Streptococcus mutans SA38]
MIVLKELQKLGREWKEPSLLKGLPVLQLAAEIKLFTAGFQLVRCSGCPKMRISLVFKEIFSILILKLFAKIENNGHTIEVKLKNKKNTLKFNGKTYTLEQFHFHAPSENQIDGKTYPLEGHFVYTTKDKKITVVSILYQYGKENKTLKQVWKKMPQKAETKKNLSQPVAISQLFPKDLNYYNFEGSLTTPPCTEGVNWIVFKKQENISKAQVKKFSKTLGYNNNRPIQKLNGREIKE